MLSCHRVTFRKETTGKPNASMASLARQYIAEEKTHLLRISLQKLIDELPTTKFVRIHRSTIINLDFLAKLARKESKPIAILKDGTERTISPSGHIE